ncbi:MAG: nucleoid-associated protein [Pedosphaera sp.]|nr:nucleoid-associated protein [Pedosphaera sp.]
MSSIGKLMKQAAPMQQQMEQVPAQFAAKTVEATSGGGAVKVTAKCDGSLAANQAFGQAKEISNAEMGKVTSGLNLPGFG